jgi:hypothetical protein
MEHIPTTRSSVRLQVPLLDTTLEYGDQPRGFTGFRDFPALSGYDIRTIDVRGDDSTGALRFLQSWLFFGLLVEAFGGTPAHLKLDEFVTTSTGGDTKIVTTAMLQKYFFYWRARRWHDERGKVVRHANEVDKCLALASAVLEVIAIQDASLYSNALDTWAPRSVVLLSIATVGEWISKARRSAVQYTDTDEIYSEQPVWKLPIVDKFLDSRGWCIGERSQLMQNCNTTCLYYLSTIDHSRTDRDHSSCSELGCTALQLNYGTYEPLHICPPETRAKCSRSGPRIRDVAGIIDNDAIPLIRVDSNGVFDMLALSEGPRRKYVAISHVWSDGLGNPRENKLNDCTLRHVQKLVNALYAPENHPVAFWIDTICIPPQRYHFTKHGDSRKRGINLMAQIYANADKVLVLDRWLQQVDFKSRISLSELTEITVRIRHAPWTTRVWTLQEGRLSQNLYFQFKHGTVTAAECLDAILAQRNLLHASSLLGLMTDDDVMGNKCAMWVLRALTTIRQIIPSIEYYASLSPQDDADEEELRLGALEKLEARKDLEPIWQRWGPLIHQRGLEQTLGDIDYHVQADLFAERIDMVSDYGGAVMNMISGQGYRHIVQSGNALRQDAYSSASLFCDLANGFRARTTSRREDEVLCLAILLRYKNLHRILSIEPIPWRWNNVIRRIGAHRTVMRCQEMRMRTLFTQLEYTGYLDGYGENTSTMQQQPPKPVNAVPDIIVFWNHPRISTLGWRWAPISILEGTSYVLRSGHYGRITPYGLEVHYPGLRIFFDRRHSDTEASCENLPSRDVTLVIHTELDATPDLYPWRQHWHCIQLSANDRTIRRSSASSSLLSDWYRARLKTPMVLLLRQDNNVRGPSAGVITQEYGAKGDALLLLHVGLVERVPKGQLADPDRCVLHVDGEWVAERKWCVG